ncbi:hypothetical protein HZD82_26285, partial [Pantoea agglomerans]|uniref:hypothetical protein n=1 Tax=Enterobacter agglomerans TaxID=549 RepID=UPI001A90C905
MPVWQRSTEAKRQIDFAMKSVCVATGLRSGMGLGEVWQIARILMIALAIVYPAAGFFHPYLPSEENNGHKQQKER